MKKQNKKFLNFSTKLPEKKENIHKKENFETKIESNNKKTKKRQYSHYRFFFAIFWSVKKVKKNRWDLLVEPEFSAGQKSKNKNR